MQGQQSTFTNRKIYRSKQLDKEFSEIQFDYSALLSFLPMYKHSTADNTLYLQHTQWCLHAGNLVYFQKNNTSYYNNYNNNNNKSNSTRFAKCRSIWRFRSVKSHDLIQTLITV